MKKILILILGSLLLVGCASNPPKLENAKTLFTINNKAYTENDLFETILNNDFGQYLVKDLESEVFSKIQEENNYDVSELVSQQIAEVRAFFEEEGVSEEVFLQYYGYQSMEAFEKELTQDLIFEKYKEALILEDVEGYIKKYELKNLVLFYAETQEIKDDIIAYINAGNSLDSVKTEFSISDSTELVYNNLASNMEDGLKDIIRGLSTENHVTSYSTEGQDDSIIIALKDSVLSDEAVVESLLSIAEFDSLILGQVFKQYGFSVKNQTLKENMKEDFSHLLD